MSARALCLVTRHGNSDDEKRGSSMSVEKGAPPPPSSLPFLFELGTINARRCSPGADGSVEASTPTIGEEEEALVVQD